MTSMGLQSSENTIIFSFIEIKRRGGSQAHTGFYRGFITHLPIFIAAQAANWYETDEQLPRIWLHHSLQTYTKLTHLWVHPNFPLIPPVKANTYLDEYLFLTCNMLTCTQETKCQNEQSTVQSQRGFGLWAQLIITCSLLDNTKVQYTLLHFLFSVL